MKDIIQKISFQKPLEGNFRKELTQRVDDYFSKNNISKKGDWRLYSKAIIIFAAFIGVYVSILLSPSMGLTWYILYALLGLIIAGSGFNVMHDASHKSFSDNAKLNGIMAFFGGDIMGGSTFIWNVKHNILHHTFTNIEGHDDDIAKYPMFRLNRYQKKLWFHKYQAWYAPFLYMVLSIHWSLINDFTRLRSGKVLIKELKINKNEKLLLYLGKFTNVTLLIIIPMFFAQAWWHVLVGFVVMHLTTGLTLAIVFQMAHVVEETEFPEPPTMDEWMLHQLATTANFAMHNKVLSWYVGGLNYQVEHHLFSNISHVHYPAISKIVQQTCKEFAIKYNAFPTFWKAIQSHFVYLNKMGGIA